MLHYILQIILFQLLFLLVYEILLKKETFFTTNRWYLLVTPVISLTLPLLRFEALGNLIPAESFVMLPEVYIGGTATPIEPPEGTMAAAESFQINWWWIAYSAGFVISLMLFINKYRILRSLFQYNTIAKDKDLQIIQVPNSSLACTFFNTIFIGDQLKEEEISQILAHEKVHVRQKHSVDLLFFELLKILFWFNPLIYIYQSRISVLHEFIADAQVAKTVEKKTYYQQLLNTAFSTQNISFINQFFNHSLIKKRIVMLQKSKSKSISKLRYLILIPLMLAMLTYVACSDDPVAIPVEEEASFEEKLQQIKAIAEDGITADEQEEINEILSTVGYAEMEGHMETNHNVVETEEIGDVPFAVIEEVPVFPGCEGLATNEERKACMSQKVTEFINLNFNTSLGRELGLKGINRIYVQFRINDDGTVEVLGARAPHPDLQEEAERVVNLLPQMTPGKQKGQEVGVLYSLPISFKVSE